jgi:hypothetical protein
VAVDLHAARLMLGDDGQISINSYLNSGDLIL